MRNRSIKAGDWVRTIDAGIWQVYRVLRGLKDLDPATGKQVREDFMFAKRFVSNNFRKSFTEGCWAEELVRPLSNPDLRKLQKFIDDNAAAFEEFQAYQPKPVDCIYNARICVPHGKRRDQVETRISRNRVLTIFEIEPWLHKLGLAAESGNATATAQFISHDHREKDGFLMFQFARVLPL